MTNTKDMYGHLIHVSDRGLGGGFGVSMTYQGAPGKLVPVFTFFHASDDYRQALFAVAFEDQEGPLGGGVRPRVVNIFDERVAEVLGLIRDDAGHASDCATHNMPAYPNGPCNCRGLGTSTMLSKP